MKVMLMVDLTKYQDGLVAGTVGRLDMKKVEYTDWGEEMYPFKAKGMRALPITMNGVAILDKAFWDKRETEARNTLYADKMVGPRGGFKGLRLYIKIRGKDRITSINNKYEAERTIELLNLYNKEIQERIV